MGLFFGGSDQGKAGNFNVNVQGMSISSGYRKHRGMDKGLGYCDLDGSQTICDGDTKFCGKPDILARYLIIRMLEKWLREVEE